MSEIGDQQGTARCQGAASAFHLCMLRQCGYKSELLVGAFESEGYIKMLGSVAGIWLGQEEAIGKDLGHFASSNEVAQDLGGMG